MTLTAPRRPRSDNVRFAPLAAKPIPAKPVASVYGARDFTGTLLSDVASLDALESLLEREIALRQEWSGQALERLADRIRRIGWARQRGEV